MLTAREGVVKASNMRLNRMYRRPRRLPMRHDVRLLVATIVLAVLSWLVASAMVPELAYAQVPDLVEISGQYMPGKHSAESPNVRPQVSSYDVALNAPIPLGEETFLIPGLTYHVESVSFDDAVVPGFTPLRAFHAVDLPILFVQLLPDDWSLSLRGSIGLAGDFEKVDGGMIRASGMAMATKSFGDDLVLGGGVLASYGFGQFLPLPALYAEWKPFDPLTIEAFLPAFVDAKVTAGDRFEIGYRAEIQGNQYGVRDERVSEAPPCAGPDAEPSRCVDSVAYSTITVGPRASLRLYATVWLDLYAGHSIYRRFEPMNDSGDAIAAGAQTLPNAFFVRSGITWRLPTGD